MRAIIYCRYSSSNQNETSISGQIRECMKYASKNNIDIIGEYKERAKSGTNDNRIEFQRMIRDAEFGNFDYVLVYKMDRFSRSVDDTGYYKKVLYDCGVEVISVTEQYGDETASLYMDALNRASAEHYSRNLSKHVKRGMKEGALKCMHMGGKPPLGYDVNSGKLYEVNGNEARIVRAIFDLYIRNWSYNDIIKYLNEKGYRTKTGNTFGKNSLHGILSNEKYCGVYIFNRSAEKTKHGKRNHHKSKDTGEIIRIEDGIPAIVSKETFEKANKIINQRKHGRSANKAHELYLLQGLIRCGDCGSMYQGNRRKSGKGNIYISYRCSCKQNKMQCSNKEIKRDAVEGYILYELENQILNPDNVPEFVNKVNEQINENQKLLNDQLKPLEKELSDVGKKILNITNSIENGIIYDGLVERLNILQNSKLELKKKIEIAKKDLQTEKLDIQSVKALFEKYIKEISTRKAGRIKQIIREFVKEVIVFDDHIEVKFNMVFLISKSEEFLIGKHIANKKEVYGLC